MSAILRHRHPNRFTVLPNDAIRNAALSFRAVGVLAHLLSLPDGAKVDSATLAAAHKEGRDAVRAAYRELEVHGYYHREVRRLSDGTLRTEVVVSSTPMKGGAAGGPDAGFSGAGPGPEKPASAEPASVEPTPVDQAPKEQGTTTENLFSPPTPRTAGGQKESVGTAGSGPGPLPGAACDATPAAPDQRDAPVRGRREAGTNPRALGTHPRSAAEQAEAARLGAEAVVRQAELERANEARRAADRAARTESDRLEAEALAVSAVLDDAHLAAVVTVVTEGMAGPLARSPLAIARAVVVWCRTAHGERPGPLADAIAAGLRAGVVAGEGSAALDLPAAPAGTTPLRHRIAGLRDRTTEA